MRTDRFNSEINRNSNLRSATSKAFGLRNFALAAACATALAFTAGTARADIVDLTSGPGSSGTLNGAFFEFAVVHPAGTGVFKPFVRIQGNGVEEGYNTSNASLPFNEKPGPWTRDLQFGEITTVELNGVDYLEFELDINESASRNQRLLSLDDIMIFTSSVGGLNTTTLADLGALRFHLDGNGDHHVLMDYTNANGSGQSDLRALIPLANFAGVSAGDFVYFYSRFGETEGAGAGFEEWRTVPEPASIALIVIGGAALMRRKRISKGTAPAAN